MTSQQSQSAIKRTAAPLAQKNLVSGDLSRTVPTGTTFRFSAYYDMYKAVFEDAATMSGCLINLNNMRIEAISQGKEGVKFEAGGQTQYILFQEVGFQLKDTEHTFRRFNAGVAKAAVEKGLDIDCPIAERDGLLKTDGKLYKLNVAGMEHLVSDYPTEVMALVTLKTKQGVQNKDILMSSISKKYVVDTTVKSWLEANKNDVLQLYARISNRTRKAKGDIGSKEHCQSIVDNLIKSADNARAKAASSKSGPSKPAGPSAANDDIDYGKLEYQSY